MLMMATPHALTTYKRDGGDDWVKPFFTVTPSHYPGTVFSYDTSSSHVLAALVERLSGKPLMDYLRQKLAVLNLSPEAKFLPDPMGEDFGSVRVQVGFRDRYAAVSMKGFGETDLKLFNGYLSAARV